MHHLVRQRPQVNDTYRIRHLHFCFNKIYFLIFIYTSCWHVCHDKTHFSWQFISVGPWLPLSESSKHLGFDPIPIQPYYSVCQKKYLVWYVKCSLQENTKMLEYISSHLSVCKPACSQWRWDFFLRKPSEPKPLIYFFFWSLYV